MNNAKRIQLLTAAEISDLYDRPDFNAEERELFFALTEDEEKILNHYHHVRTRVYFVLQLGYFKAKQQFFQFDFNDVLADSQFIHKTRFGKEAAQWAGHISRDSIRAQKQDILTLFDYHDWSADSECQIQHKLGKLLRYYPKAHNALRQLLLFISSKNIIVPSYRKLQDMFSAAFASEEARLQPMLLGIPVGWQEQLSKLIEHDNGLNQLNSLRADQKDFQFTAVRFEIEKAQKIEGLYHFADQFLPSLKLSKNVIRYYADVVAQYAAFRLQRLGKTQQWLYALCFIFHRYQQIMDNLLVTFLYHTNAMIDSGKVFSDMEQLKHSSRVIVDFPHLARFLQWFPERDGSLTHEELNEKAYQLLPKPQFALLANFLAGNAFDKTAAKWQYYASTSRSISLYLRPVVLAVPFSYYKKDSEVMELISLIKTHYSSGGSPGTLRISDDLGLTIPKHMSPYLKRKPEDEQLDPYLFEFYVYQKMNHLINRGKLCCNASVSYSDIEHDLVHDALVDDVENIAREFGYPKIPVYCRGLAGIRPKNSRS